MGSWCPINIFLYLLGLASVLRNRSMKPLNRFVEFIMMECDEMQYDNTI
jgi:hypothetical protein